MILRPDRGFESLRSRWSESVFYCGKVSIPPFLVAPPGPIPRSLACLHHLDPADLRTGGAIFEPGKIFGCRRYGTKVVDEDARVEKDGQESNSASRSASTWRELLTSLSPSPR
jgi:hypothetical protein